MSALFDDKHKEPNGDAEHIVSLLSDVAMSIECDVSCTDNLHGKHTLGSRMNFWSKMGSLPLVAPHGKCSQVTHSIYKCIIFRHIIFLWNRSGSLVGNTENIYLWATRRSSTAQFKSLGPATVASVTAQPTSQGCCYASYICSWNHLERSVVYIYTDISTWTFFWRSSTRSFSTWTFSKVIYMDLSTARWEFRPGASCP